MSNMTFASIATLIYCYLVYGILVVGALVILLFLCNLSMKLWEKLQDRATMREITKADMDKPIEPKVARDAVTAVRDIAAYLTVGEWCLIMAGVKKAVERMTQEEDDEV